MHVKRGATTLEQETKKLNQILDKIIRRILMTPESTPREALYIKSGLLDIETIAESKRLNMKARLNRDKSLMMEQILANPNCLWEAQTRKTMVKYNISQNDLMNSEYATKSLIKKNILRTFKTKTDENLNEKSKIKYFSEGKQNWRPGQGQNI